MSATDSATPPRPPLHAAPHAAPPSRFAGLGAIAFMLLIVALAAFLVVFFWQMDRNRPATPLAPAADQGDIAALRDRIAADEARLAVLEKGGEAGGTRSALAQAQGDLASLSARVGRLETAPDPQAAARLDEFDRRLAAAHGDFDLRLGTLERNALGTDLPQHLAALQSAQDALAARVAHLENIEPSVTMKRAAATLALADLVRAAGSQGAFPAQLAALRAMLPDAPEAAALAPLAARGAPTQAQLAQRFPSMAANALEAETAARATSLLGRIWASIANLIVIRHLGDRPGADSDAILARAQARLGAGDLDGAVADMRGLKGAARAAAQGWLDDAQARLAITRNTAALADRLAKLLAAP